MDGFSNIRANIKRTMIFGINPNRPERANKIIVDYFSELDEITSDKFISISTNTKRKSTDSNLGKHILNYRYILGIVLLALFTTVIGFIQDLLIQSIQKVHVICSSTGILPLDLFIWVIFSLALCLISCYVSSFIPKTAEESEIAEVKAVLSGVKIPKFFGYQTLFLKLLTVILLIGSGISMGKEGAFVHISGIISYKLMKSSFLNFIFKNATRRNQFLSVSFSAGLATVFNSSIGAMIFSIEISSSFYVVSNMWRAALCTLLCSIFTKLLQMSGLVSGVKYSEFKSVGTDFDTFSFGLLGFCCGLLGYCFIMFSRFLVYHRLHRTVPLIHSRYRYLIIVSVTSALLTFWTTFLEAPDISVMNSMFAKRLDEPALGGNFLAASLIFYILIKFLTTALATSLEASVGVIFPMFACGAAFGRLFGLAADAIMGTELSNEYAAVGAAALVSALTHSISVPIVIFSMTGQIHYLVPMMVAVFIAYSISNALTVSFYDSMLTLKKISYLPLLQSPEMYDLSAMNLVNTRFPCLTLDSNIGDLIDALYMCTKYVVSIPIIDREGLLQYEISLKRAKKYLKLKLNEIYHGLGQHSQDYLVKVIQEVLSLNADDNFPNERFGIRASRAYSQPNMESLEVRKFMSTSIDFTDSVLKSDDSPFSIVHSTVFAKIQFMFLMLNLSQIYVTEKGVLIGIIVRDSFVKTALRHNYSVY